MLMDVLLLECSLTDSSCQTPSASQSGAACRALPAFVAYVTVSAVSTKQRQVETAWDRVQRGVPTITISAQLRQVLDEEDAGELCLDDVARPQDLARVVRRVREVAH